MQQAQLRVVSSSLGDSSTAYPICAECGERHPPKPQSSSRSAEQTAIDELFKMLRAREAEIERLKHENASLRAAARPKPSPNVAPPAPDLAGRLRAANPNTAKEDRLKATVRGNAR